jgi:hypothetical protein
LLLKVNTDEGQWPSLQPTRCEAGILKQTGLEQGYLLKGKERQALHLDVVEYEVRSSDLDVGYYTELPAETRIENRSDRLMRTEEE